MAVAEGERRRDRRIRTCSLELAAAHVAQAAPDRLRRVDVDDEQCLLEPGRPRDDLTFVVEHDRMTVEDELVLTADEVAERKVRRVVARPRDEHLLAILRLADVERGGGEVDEQRRAGECEIGCRWARLPHVLADRRPDEHVAYLQEHELAPRREVPMLVEDAVVRQEVLAVDALDGSVCTDEGGVCQIAVEGGGADERHRAGTRPRDLLDRVARCADEPGPEQQVLRRVPRDGELRENDEVGPGARCLVDRFDDAADVAVEVADDDVQLGERDSHRPILAARRERSPFGGFRLSITNVTLAA